MNLRQAFLRFPSIKRCASDLPVSHMDSFFWSQGRWETSLRGETRISQLEGTRRLLTWLCARRALALELFVNCYSPSSVTLRCGSAKDAEQIVATRCLCRYRVIPAVKVLWSFQCSNSLGCLVNNIGTAECFGVLCCSLFVSRGIRGGQQGLVYIQRDVACQSQMAPERKWQYVASAPPLQISY